MTALKKIGFIFMLMLLTCCSTIPNHFEGKQVDDIAQQGEIWDSKTQQIITANELINQLSQAQIVLVGEKHNVLAHHRAQQWLIYSLTKQRHQASIVMEMLQTNQQDSVNSVQQQFNDNQPLKANKVRKLISWQKGWDWQAYGALVMQILQQGTALFSGNLDFSAMKEIYAQQPKLSGEYSNQPYVTDALTKTITESHQNANVPAMLAVQKHRDRQMAKQLLAAPKPTMLIAGNFHARKDLGVPLHLKDLNPPLATKTKVILLLDENNNFNHQQADYIWIIK